MELTFALINTFVVVAVGLALRHLVKDRWKALQAEVQELRAEMKAEISRLDDRMGRLEARMDAGFNAVRSDLTRVALAVGAGGTAVEG
jgi:hypothetical protein